MQLLLNPGGIRTRLSHVTYSGSSASVSFATIAGLTYTLEYTDDLKELVNWTRLMPTIIGTGSAATAVDSLPDPQMRFYRVCVE